MGKDQTVTVGLNVAQHVLWHFGDTNLGLQPGGYIEQLFRLMDHADLFNRERLRLAYPEYAEAFFAVKNTHWGLEWLRKMVKAGIA